MLVSLHAAESESLHHKRFYHTLRLHHHGEGEKALLQSAKKRVALGVAFFNNVVFSWRPAEVGRQFLWWWAALIYRRAGP
jgi:hypothetical protein